MVKDSQKMEILLMGGGGKGGVVHITCDTPYIIIIQILVVFLTMCSTNCHHSRIVVMMKHTEKIKINMIVCENILRSEPLLHTYGLFSMVKG